ncbi:MAG: S8 family serine peptidase [Acidobacteriota bacterium]
MRSSRVRLFSLALLIGIAAMAGSRAIGQAPAPGPLDVVIGVGLPAIDRGVVADRSRVPDSPETRRRRSIRSRANLQDRLGAGGLHYRGGRVLVRFRDGMSSASRLSALSATARTAAISTRPSSANFDVVQIDASEDAEAVAQALAQRGDVEYAQAAYRVHTEFKPNDPLYASRQWNLPLIDMERAWDIQPLAGSSIVVAVIDTGVAYTNATVSRTASAFIDEQGVSYPALGPLTLPYAAAPQLGGASRFVAPHDFIWNSGTPLDFDGHGTHVSGTIGQLTNDNTSAAGVAYGVKLMPIKVIDSIWDQIFGSPNEATDEVVARGIRYAADNGAKVLNLSLGRSGPADCGTRPAQPGCSPVIEDAIRYAVGKGAFIAVSGGNDFEDGNPTEVLGEIASRVNGAVSVAAVDPLKNRSFYSSTGAWIELSAPGGSNRGFRENGYIWQQTLDFNFVETFLQPPARYQAPRFDVVADIGYIGTSQAAPHVAGVAAMLMQQGVTDPAAVEAALERFATDLGDPGRDPLYGFGLVEARNTLRGLGIAR